MQVGQLLGMLTTSFPGQRVFPSLALRYCKEWKAGRGLEVGLAGGADRTLTIGGEGHDKS